MLLDYEMLRLVSWGVLGLFVIGFVLSSGIEIGVSMLLPFLNASEPQRAALVARLAPTSAGNQIWLLATVGVLFAGWPTVYAATFASFQPLLLLTVLSLFVRPLGWYFRASVTREEWLKKWDKALFISGLLPAALLGVMAGNLLKGVPFHLASDMHIAFLGSFSGLFSPFASLVGATCVALLTVHGAIYLQTHTQDALYQRSKALAMSGGLAFLVLFALAGGWITHLEGYHVSTEIMPNGVSNPLTKFVKRGDGLWLDNYEHEPALWALPVLAFVCGIAALVLSRLDKTYWALLASAVTVVMVILTMGVSMFPFLAPSNISLNSSLTIWDASASLTTLNALLCLTGVLLPLMAIATRGLYKMLP
ncbi:cytochrome d ubiquinol oxidase subunit II [Methylomonas rosea]|uniref:Cytochrome d ubiquinol oxidase subunit II n=1 Tax=Methylomonas rosea TaxID=2952227 RepID=A0ABT1TNE0_9GAMM|nr:cytochrome d ubiquinol oxidase subunit II [Methylomonas sp. WSC-7]MCQ8116306.1 cytochrome d ubiquinol oxidase subunit II [Methylomonas sp. WSC-7]